MKKAVVAGSINFDIFLSLMGVPQIGETAKAAASSSGAGGKGANQAVQMAKLGLDVSMIGRIGADQMGRNILDGMKENGVDCAWIKETPGTETGMGIVDVFPDGNVVAVINGGANEQVAKADIQEAKTLMEKMDMLVLQLEIPAETVVYAVELASKNGKKILLNAAPAVELPESCMRKCTYIVVNEVEASFYAGAPVNSLEDAKRILPELTERYQNCWICTLGKLGAVIAKDGQIMHIPAVQTEVVETTGAGDSFVGGFAYGILQGMDEGTAGQFAAWCSAATIHSVGAQKSMPTLKQINMMKREYGIL